MNTESGKNMENFNFPENFEGVKTYKDALESFTKSGAVKNNMMKYLDGLNAKSEIDDPMYYLYDIFCNQNLNNTQLETELYKHLPTDIKNIHFKRIFSQYFGWDKKQKTTTDNRVSNARTDLKTATSDDIINILYKNHDAVDKGEDPFFFRPTNKIHKKERGKQKTNFNKTKVLFRQMNITSEEQFETLIYELREKYGSIETIKAINDIIRREEGGSFKLVASTIKVLNFENAKNFEIAWDTGWKELFYQYKDNTNSGYQAIFSSAKEYAESKKEGSDFIHKMIRLKNSNGLIGQRYLVGKICKAFGTNGISLFFALQGIGIEEKEAKEISDSFFKKNIESHKKFPI